MTAEWPPHLVASRSYWSDECRPHPRSTCHGWNRRRRAREEDPTKFPGNQRASPEKIKKIDQLDQLPTNLNNLRTQEVVETKKYSTGWILKIYHENYLFVVYVLLQPILELLIFPRWSDGISDQLATNSTNFRPTQPTSDQPPTNFQPTSDQLPTNFRPTSDQLPTNFRPTSDQLDQS